MLDLKAQFSVIRENKVLTPSFKAQGDKAAESQGRPANLPAAELFYPAAAITAPPIGKIAYPPSAGALAISTRLYPPSYQPDISIH